jgi:hypothetical protein
MSTVEAPSPAFPPPSLDRSIRFGSHLFVNPEDRPEWLRGRIKVLAEAEFRLIRLFLPWGQVEPRPGVWQWSPFDEIFDEAAARGMKIVVTLMSVSPPGWAGLTGGLQDVADLDDEAFFTRSLAHVQTVVTHFKDHPALDSWILWNEPCREIRPDQPNAIRAFQRFLRKSHGGNIEAYNATHYRPAASFDQIAPGGGGAYETGFGSHRAKVEWLEFTVENLQEKLEAIAREVRRLDACHPIHVNPHRISQCLADAGQSIWREADTVDFLGCSAHPAWHSVRFPRHRYADSVAMFADLMRSATRAPQGYFWVTELQGGGTLLSAFESLAPTPAEARVWLWQSIAAGAKAVIYWCANGRTDGYEAGEWDLLDFRGEASPRLRMITETIRSLTPHLPLLARASIPQADIGIIISEESLVLDLVEGLGDDPANPRNRQKGADAVAGAYLLASDLSLEVAFYDLRRLRETPVDALPRILILPSLAVVDAETVALLHSLAASGLLIVADGFFAWKDRHGRLSKTLWPAAARLWGAECTGYEAIASRHYATEQGSSLLGWFARSQFETTQAEIAATWDDGEPACLHNRIGGGAAFRIGTHFFQRYFTEADPAGLAWFQQLIEGYLAKAPRLLNPGATLRLRRLASPGGELGFLINSDTRTQTAKILNAEGIEETVIVPAQNGRVVFLDKSLPAKATPILASGHRESGG